MPRRSILTYPPEVQEVMRARERHKFWTRLASRPEGAPAPCAWCGRYQPGEGTGEGSGTVEGWRHGRQIYCTRKCMVAATRGRFGNAYFLTRSRLRRWQEDEEYLAGHQFVDQYLRDRGGRASLCERVWRACRYLAKITEVPTA